MDISIIQYSLSFDGHRPPYFFQRKEFPISIKPTKIQSIWIQIAREGRKGSLSLRKPSEPLFIRLIIRTFQLVFSVRIVFFSHNKSVNSVFQPAYQHSRTGPNSLTAIT
jgi:hypothetical protein